MARLEISRASSKKDNPLWVSLADQLTAFSDLLRPYGVEKVPYVDQDRELFLNLPNAKQTKICKKFQKYSRVYFTAQKKLISIGNSKEMLKLFLSSNCLRFATEWESHIVTGAVEEIYDADLIQEYGNIEFLRLCNYPMLKVFLMPFPELYHRDEQVTQKIVDHCQHTLKAGRGFREFAIGKHLMREISSEKKIFFEIENLEACPLFDQNGQATHFFCNQWARPSDVNSDVSIIY